MDVSKAPKTLVLALSTDCKYCKASLPFYRRLLSENPSLRAVALFPDRATQIRAFLKQEGVEMQFVERIDLTKLGFRGTPTALVVNRSGQILNSWPGALDKNRELEVTAGIAP